MAITTSSPGYARTQRVVEFCQLDVLCCLSSDACILPEQSSSFVDGEDAGGIFLGPKR